MKSEECIELKNIKYKSMLLNNNADEVVETVENMSNLDHFLEGEKKNNSGEPWAKLDKTSKLLYGISQIIDVSRACAKLLCSESAIASKPIKSPGK